MIDVAIPKTMTKSLRLGKCHVPLPPIPEIPRRRYIDPDFYNAEIKHVWHKSWLMVGHVSEYPTIGSYQALDIPFAPIILVKGKDGVIRAFINACRHRGALVVRDNKGCTRAMSCQYHGWTYDLDGTLKSVPDEETFPGLDKQQLGLEPVNCQLWGGFIFINFDKNASPLDEWLAPIINRHSEVASAPMKMVTRQSFKVDCNWKIAIEAFYETYHINFVHRNTAAQGLVGPDSCFEIYPNGHGSMLIPFRNNLLDTDWEGMVAKSELPILPGTQKEDFMHGVVQVSTFPNTAFGFQPQGFPIFLVWPLAIDRCRIELFYFVGDWGNGPKPKEIDPIISALEVLTAEDIANLAAIQKAVEADAEKGSPLSTQECLIYAFHAEIDNMISEENIPETIRVHDILKDYQTR